MKLPATFLVAALALAWLAERVFWGREAWLLSGLTAWALLICTWLLLRRTRPRATVK